MYFVDEVTLIVQSGKGGDGCVSFRREKYIPKGGPDGGDGGKGGSVIFQANHQLSTLQHFRYKKRFKALDGKQGQGALKTGKSAPDLVLKVPCGTLFFNPETGSILKELLRDGDSWIVCKGGKGGRGNAFFKSSTHQVPQHAEPGTLSETCTLRLELKLLADIGLVGFPNTGKSTLLSRLSRAKPKIANYPFTTLVPQLGVIETTNEHHFVLADIPGLIQGAHQGKGLGDQFLRHIERTRLLLYLIDLTAILEITSPLKAKKILLNTWLTLENELRSFHPKLIKKPFLLALTKSDLFPSDKKTWLLQLVQDLKKTSPLQKASLCFISSHTGEHLPLLLSMIEKKLLSMTPVLNHPSQEPLL